MQDPSLGNPLIPQGSLPEHTSDTPHYDKDLAGEIRRVQASVSEKPGETRMQAVSRHLNHTVNEGFEGSYRHGRNIEGGQELMLESWTVLNNEAVTLNWEAYFDMEQYQSLYERCCCTNLIRMVFSRLY